MSWIYEANDIKSMLKQFQYALYLKEIFFFITIDDCKFKYAQIITKCNRNCGFQYPIFLTKYSFPSQENTNHILFMGTNAGFFDFLPRTGEYTQNFFVGLIVPDPYTPGESRFVSTLESKFIMDTVHTEHREQCKKQANKQTANQKTMIRLHKTSSLKLLKTNII